MAAFTLPGAIIGAIYAIRISNEAFQKLLGIVMIGIVITMMIPSSKKFVNEKIIGKVPWLIYPIMFALGFYGGFIQVGIGFLLMIALHRVLKMNMVYVNFHKVFIVMFYTIPALIIFMVTGNINWIYGISLAAGTGLGAWWSAKIAVRKGEKVIKIVLTIAILIMSLKLLNVF